MTSPPSSGSVRRTGNRGLLAAVTPATVFSAGSGYVLLLLAAWVLGAEGYEQFAVYWATFFAVAGVLGGLSNETTRSVFARKRGRGGGSNAAAPFAIAWVFGIAAGAIVWLSSPAWADRLIPGHEGVGTALLALALTSAVPQMALMGILAGSQRWRLYAVGILLDASARVVAAVVATAVAAPEVGFLVATVAGAFTWGLLPAFSRRCRAALRTRGDVTSGQFSLRTAKAMLAGAGSALLIVGFPALLKLTAPDAAPETLSALLLAVTLTRAPLLVPTIAFQNALVVHYVQRRQDLAALARLVALVAAVTLVGAWLAGLVGPTVMSWMGEGFVADAGLLTGLTFGAGTLAVALLSGYAALAHELHTTYVLGWWVAALVAILVLMTPLDLEARVIWALVVGPLVGAGLHVGGILRSRRS